MFGRARGTWRKVDVFRAPPLRRGRGLLLLEGLPAEDVEGDDGAVGGASSTVSTSLGRVGVSGLSSELGDSGGLGRPFVVGGDGSTRTTGTVGGDVCATSKVSSPAAFSYESKASCIAGPTVGGGVTLGVSLDSETLRECVCRLDWPLKSTMSSKGAHCGSYPVRLIRHCRRALRFWHRV